MKTPNRWNNIFETNYKYFYNRKVIWEILETDKRGGRYLKVLLEFRPSI